MKPNRAVVIGAYAVAFLLVVIPIVDLTLRLWPLQVSQVPWRFGATGILTTTIVTPLLGILIGGAVAFRAAHRRVVRALAVITIMGMLFLLVLTGLYVLDALEVRRITMPEALYVFDVTAVQAFLKLCLVITIAGLLGIGGWTSAKAGRSSSAASSTLRRTGRGSSG